MRSKTSWLPGNAGARWAFAILALTLMLGACAEAPTATEPSATASAVQFDRTDTGPLTGPAGSMVFYSARTGDLEIYAMDPNGDGVQRITDSPGEDIWPDLSPNGRYVTFASQRTGNREIFVTDLQTGDVWNVSNSSGDDNWPRWSPNGRHIAFHSNRDGNYELYVVQIDGTELHRVTNNPVLDQWPDWSPNGKQLAFRRGMDVYVIDADGEEQNPLALTNLPLTIDQMPVWSPNGQQIAFMSFRDGYCSVFLMNASGDTPADPAVNLTPKDPADANSLWCSRAPAWSRDGQHIYFMSFRPETGGAGAAFNELYVMNADGSGVLRLTNSAGEDGGPQAR
jgi:Tol biopolymer transport system component